MSNLIAAVVVTYNRKEELKKNIEALLHQTRVPDIIFIIDNCSTDGTSEFFAKRNDKVKVIRLNSNTGGAGGFSVGTQIAYERGFDYIMLMDDDGRPHDENTIAELMRVAMEHQRDKIMLNPLVCVKEDVLSFDLDGLKNVDEVLKRSDDGLYKNQINPFNGTFLSKELVADIGYPNADFFIKGDETDYKNRAKNVGAFVATVVNSHYYHPAITHDSVNFLGIDVVNDLEAPWKEYYRIRNYTYMYGFKIIYMLSKRTIKSVMIRDSNWMRRIEMMFHGFIDGKRKKMGKNVEPGQLKYKKG